MSDGAHALRQFTRIHVILGQTRDMMIEQRLDHHPASAVGPPPAEADDVRGGIADDLLTGPQCTAGAISFAIVSDAGMPRPSCRAGPPRD
jgi:hypothetical protein